ncbi:DUF3572 domain-containing protein [Ancylobacter mangrovi]|uniref:DUF3572 domain-containing protein n=1 Tax=Ancylobacter mangrovi TaxID=2972472 RepID=UPI002163126C|nr:DUF3572 domain-containing protein [Ancylobacter mangrovi]MCS0501585.1 DUF3572 domain-containing protein [Ancylobacter mangrovi]
MRDGVGQARNYAEWIAIRVLGALANDALRLERFLTEMGIEARAVRTCASDPRFLASLLDWVAEEPALAEAIMSETGIRADDVTMARHVLRGGDEETCLPMPAGRRPRPRHFP